MGKNDERLIFGIGFDLKSGVDEVIEVIKSKELPRIQKILDKKPLKISLEIKKNFITELRDFVRVTREVVNAQRQINKAKKEELDIAAKAAMVKTREANQRSANVRAAVQEATQQDQINKKKADAAYSEERLAQAKKNGISATHAQNAAYKTQGNYLSRLLKRMVAYASVAQAFSFIRNIREVTAEFELQRVALGSIIGDLNEANAMFEQIKAAAVKSPFQIKELVTYTKQLAAYKIESDKLFETTQRLADISAGLGVGMERLVLAYGQIRATGYLRASEVRQLTEAGIPIVEELAKKMSQLRNETVSAAEVMGMISERAISFGMVKEVFDDMTSAGGMFYKMQEKQAETLAGQWSNLKDSISIMYEEIGNTESVNNSIKGTIGLVKSLAENWRTIGVVMITALEGYGVYKGFSALLSAMTFKMTSLAVATKNHEIASNKASLAIARFGKVGRLMTWHLTKQTKLLKQAAKETNFWKMSLLRLRAFLWGNFWNIALIGIGAIVAKIVSARIEANRLNKELERIGTEGDVQSRTQVNNFERLAKVIRDSADGSLRQTEALKEMKRAYGEFLPSQDKEIINLVRAKEGYETVSQAIREKIALQVQEQKVNAVTSEYSKMVSDYLPDLKALLEPKGIDVSRVYSALKTAIEDGGLTLIGSVKEDAEAINAILEKELGITLDLFNEGRQLTIKGWKDTFNPTRAMELLQPILNAETELRNAIQDIEYDLLSDTGITGIYAEKWDELQRNLNGITAKGEVGSFEWNKDKTRKEIELYHNFIKERIAEINKGLSDDKKIKFDIGDVLDFDALDEALGNKYPQLKQVIAKIQKEYEKLIPTDITRLANDKLQEYADKVGISMDEVKEHLKTNEQSTEDWAKGLEGAYESLEKKLAEYKLNRDDAISIGKKSHWSKEVKEVEDEMKVLKLLMDFFKEFLSQSGGGKKTNPRIALLNEELSTVEKIYKEYQELRKFMSEDDARARVADMFEGVNLTMLSQALSPTEMRAQLQKALDEAKKMGDKKQILELEYKLGKFDVDEEQRKLEKSLKDLSDKISRTKTAKEFFDRMLGLTGNKELSATLTLSVYGTTGDDLQKLLTQQVTDAFKNLPEGFDITKAMLGGGKFDYNLLESWIKHLPEAQRQNAQSIVDNWRKANADILTDLQKSYEDFMTYEERKTRVVEKENAERMRIINSGLPMAEQEKLIEASQKRENKALADIAIEEFKASEDWVKSFEDLENLATPTIERLMAKLKEFIDTQKDLTPEQLKTLTNEYKKLYDGLIARNPFKAMTDGIKEYIKATQNVKVAKDRVEAAQEELRIATERKATAEQNFRTSQDVATAGREYASAIKEYNKASQNAANADKDLGDALDAQKTALNKTIQGFNAASSAISNFGSIITDITEILGIAEDSEVGAFIKDLVKWLGVMASVLGTMAAIIAVIEAELAPLLAIAAGIAAIGAAISFLSNAKVRKANKEIERQQELLDNLAYSYERLEKAQEKAFGSDYISNYEQRLANLQAQQEAYLKQANAERSKGKKADEDKIKEYEEAYREATDNVKDMQSELSEYFLGTDLTSAARDFASAWIEAYEEFGSTTDAMKEKFQDMIQNMIVNSLAAKIMERALEPVFTMIDEMNESDFYDPSFWQDLMAKGNKAITDGSVGLENVYGWLESIGVQTRNLGGELTGISRDIASASEESILGLAAGINTQNFYISQVPTKLDTIIGLLRGGSAVVDSGVNVQDLITIQNQFLSHLPTIAQNTAETVARCERAAVACESMASKLGSVIKPKGTTSTHSVNVTIGS